MRALLPLLLGVLFAASPARAAPLPESWPPPGGAVWQTGHEINFPSGDPFTLAEVPRALNGERIRRASARLVIPESASPEAPVPAVVLLHGAGGVSSAREMTYARQLSSLGVAALVIDVFGARRDLATSFTERLIHITETMMLADAYAGLRFLDSLPEIDAERVALIGFSYGGLAATLALYDQVASAFTPPEGPRFAAHVAFYAPCIARFERKETTGSPLLMLSGGQDAIVDPTRCAEIVGDLESGGSTVETVTFPDAMHQWDGSFSRPWRAPRNIADCALEVDRDGEVHDSLTGLPMLGDWTRTLILAACTDSDGYLIARDDEIRERSNAILARFLNQALAIE